MVTILNLEDKVNDIMNKDLELKIQVQMNHLLRLINKFKNFSYKDLININEEEFEKNKEMKLKGK